MSEWISVEDELPEFVVTHGKVPDAETFLTFPDYNKTQYGLHNNEVCWYRWDYYRDMECKDDKVTHWKRLVPPQ